MNINVQNLRNIHLTYSSIISSHGQLFQCSSEYDIHECSNYSPWPESNDSIAPNTATPTSKAILLQQTLSAMSEWKNFILVDLRDCLQNLNTNWEERQNENYVTSPHWGINCNKFNWSDLITIPYYSCRDSYPSDMILQPIEIEIIRSC